MAAKVPTSAVYSQVAERWQAVEHVAVDDGYFVVWYITTAEQINILQLFGRVIQISTRLTEYFLSQLLILLMRTCLAKYLTTRNALMNVYTHARMLARTHEHKQAHTHTQLHKKEIVATYVLLLIARRSHNDRWEVARLLNSQHK